MLARPPIHASHTPVTGALLGAGGGTRTRARTNGGAGGSDTEARAKVARTALAELQGDSSNGVGASGARHPGTSSAATARAPNGLERLASVASARLEVYNDTAQEEEAARDGQGAQAAVVAVPAPPPPAVDASDATDEEEEVDDTDADEDERTRVTPPPSPGRWE